MPSCRKSWDGRSSGWGLLSFPSNHTGHLQLAFPCCWEDINSSSNCLQDQSSCILPSRGSPSWPAVWSTAFNNTGITLDSLPVSHGISPGGAPISLSSATTTPSCKPSCIILEYPQQTCGLRQS